MLSLADGRARKSIPCSTGREARYVRRMLPKGTMRVVEYSQYPPALARPRGNGAKKGRGAPWRRPAALVAWNASYLLAALAIFEGLPGLAATKAAFALAAMPAWMACFLAAPLASKIFQASTKADAMKTEE